MKNWIRDHKTTLLSIAGGAVAGYLYYALVGCKSGHCLIASRPYIIVPYGALLGYFLVGSFSKKSSVKQEKP
jgi:hypothetical protein